MSVTKPAWTFVGTGGQNVYTTGKRKPVAIVCHIMQGTLAGCDSWFSDPRAQASANFGVGKGGEIHCYVDPDGTSSPWANGKLAGQGAAVEVLLAEEGGVNPNLWTVSIEHEGMSGEALTPAQLAASAGLAAWLCAHFGIPADRLHLLGHYQFDAVMRAHCPGWSVDTWKEWLDMVQSDLGGPAGLTVEQRLADLEANVSVLTGALSRLNEVLVKRLALIHQATDPANPPG
jgi:hypothetical protein